MLALMQRVVIHGPGGYEKLRIERHAAPRVGPGQVRVRTVACGVNYADCVVRMGLYESAKKYVGWPITPGFEFAGVVSETGAGVDLAVGTEVLGVTRFGAYATEVVVPAHQLWPRPPGLDMHQAAAFPTTHLTAWYALVALARPRAGEAVLVHSAAGGVGTALLQIARHLGCHVVGVVGADHKVEVARAHGAHEVVVRSAQTQGLALRREDAEAWAAVRRAAPQGYAVVLDANGVSTLRRSYDHLAPGGRLVIYGFHSMLPRGKGRPSWPKLALDWLRTPRFDPLRLTGSNRGVLGFNLSYMFEHTQRLAEAMDELLAWLAAGHLAAPRVRVFPFARVADAHRALESGQTVGKLVLAMD